MMILIILIIAFNLGYNFISKSLLVKFLKFRNDILSPCCCCSSSSEINKLAVMPPVVCECKESNFVFKYGQITSKIKDSIIYDYDNCKEVEDTDGFDDRYNE